jgi:hypothetical protein
MLPLPRLQGDDHSRSMGLAPAAVRCGHLPASRQDVNTTRKGYSHALAGSSPSHAILGLVDGCSLTKLGAGFGRRPFPNSSSAEVSSSVLSAIAQPSTARGGCLSSLAGGRQISRCGFLPRNRVRRGGSAFAAAPTSRPLNTKARENAVQSFAHVPENHRRQSLSVCGWRGNTQPREARNAVPEKRTFG